jgi:predicted O-methyltransferase YrrM
MIIGHDQFFKLFGSGEAPGARGEMYATPDDRVALLALCRAFRPRTVVEIGVQEGRTAALLLRECPWIRDYLGVDVPADFAPALDTQRPEVPVQAGSRAAADPRFRLLLVPGGSATLRPDPLVAEADLVYIDGSHAEADVRHDTALARAFARPGAVIVWHDYPSCIGVQRVIDSLNDAEGDHIALIEGTWLCFQIWRGQP